MLHAVPTLLDPEKKVLWAEAINMAEDLTNWSASIRRSVPLVELFLGEPLELPELVKFGKIAWLCDKQGNLGQEKLSSLEKIDGWISKGSSQGQLPLVLPPLQKSQDLL